MQQIGVEAVYVDKGLEAGLKKYQSQLSQANVATDKATKTANRLGSVLDTAVGTAIGSLSGQVIPKLVDAFGDMIKEADEARQIENQLDAVLKSTGGEAGITKDAVMELADSYSRLTTFEGDSIVAAETVLLRFKSISKETFPEATKVTLDLATALKMDLTSAAKLLGKALEDPATGMSKLRAAGVNFTDEQEKVIKQLVETGNTAAAQKMIIDELNKSIGGSAVAAANSYAGQLKILENQIGDIKEKIGGQFLPVLIQLTEMLNQQLVPAMEKVIGSSDEWSKTMTLIAGDTQRAFNQIDSDAQIKLPTMGDILAGVMDLARIKVEATAKAVAFAWKAALDLMRGDFYSFNNDMWAALDQFFRLILTTVGVDLDQLKGMFSGALDHIRNVTNQILSIGGWSLPTPTPSRPVINNGWGVPSRHFGGAIERSGLYNLLAGEHVLNRQQAMQWAPMLTRPNVTTNSYSFQHTWNGAASSFDRGEIQRIAEDAAYRGIRRAIP